MSSVESLKFVINNNGDAAKTLMENYRNVFLLAMDLDKAMALASPHARNYQTAEVGEFEADVKLWNELRTQLKNIENVAAKAGYRAIQKK